MADIKSISDHEIMLMVKAGDLEKLGLLFERHKQLLYAYFFRHTHCIHTSEDSVQNVFLRILKYRQRFKGHGKFTSWMYYIARNVFLDHLKTNAVSLSDPESLHDELSDGTTGETHYLQKELKQIVSYGLRHNTTEITRSTTLPGGYYGKT